MTSAEALRLLLKGVGLGFSIAAPVGPIGVLVMRRSIARGFRAGLASGLGAATADAVYGMLAAAGLTLAADFLLKQAFWTRLLGGGFLLFLGLRIFFSRPPDPDAPSPHDNEGADFLSTFLLTLSNPMTIIAFAAILGGLGSAGSGALRPSAMLLVLGVFCGSALWWLALSALMSTLRTRLTVAALLWVNRAAGAAIAILAWSILWGIMGA